MQHYSRGLLYLQAFSTARFNQARAHYNRGKKPNSNAEEKWCFSGKKRINPKKCKRLAAKPV